MGNDAPEDGWMSNNLHTQPGMTKGKRVDVIWTNGRRAKQSFPADTLNWAAQHDWGIGSWKLAE